MKKTFIKLLVLSIILTGFLKGSDIINSKNTCNNDHLCQTLDDFSIDLEKK